MIGIHPVHRRMAEIELLAQKLGGYDKLPFAIQIELGQCIRVNYNLVTKLDGLK